MRKAVIVCIQGSAPTLWSGKDERRFREKLAEFEKVRIVTPRLLSLQILETWFRLLEEGFTEVTLAGAVFSRSGGLVLTGERTALPTAGLN